MGKTMSAQVVRIFHDQLAVREQVPLLIGLMGCSGSGKTMSALRLATGIQQVTGGDIYGIDTEARRMLHYADHFKFRHVEFNAPFGSLDYLAAMQHCINQGAKTIIVDSMTHEHSGPGGYLQTQEAEIERMAGNDFAKRERVKFAAWIKPAALRSRMITGLLQMNANFVFCFRAKEKTKPSFVDGKMVPIELGYQPIAGDELLFEMTVNMLLPPNSGGLPQWQSEYVGERQMMKLPQQFKTLLAEHKPLDESLGHGFALWAKGDSTARPIPENTVPHRAAVDEAAPAPLAVGAGAADLFPGDTPMSDERTAAEWDVLLKAEADKGTAALRAMYRQIPKPLRPQLDQPLEQRHLLAARAADAKIKATP